ncbi:MAG TPA: porin, partial [Thermoanaerobaculia bacterium]|nr:porin [Thermoanaerobaculia bacterium]
WREYTWQDVSVLRPGAGAGNNPAPVVGQVVTADSIATTQKSEIDTPVSNAWITANLFGRVKLTGTYIKADGTNDTGFAEADAGKFVSFELARIFAGLTETDVSRAHTDFWRASARAEITLLPNVSLAGGWAENSRLLDGQALISSLFLDTVTYAGQSAGDLLKEINARTSVDDMTRTYDANVTARQLGPVAVDAGWTQVQQNVTATPDASEIVIPGGQGGRYERRVNTYGGGATFSQWGLTLAADYHHDSADQPIFRTDFMDRDRVSARATYKIADFLDLGASFRDTKASDDAVTIGYDTQVREFQGQFDVAILKNMLTIHGAGGEFLTNRQILIREPQDFTVVPTEQKELGHNWEGGVHFTWNALSLDAGYLWMNNNGSIPFTVQRIRAMAEYFFTKNWGVDFEWLQDKYDERIAFDQAGPLANYNGNRYYVGLHWRP